jgi:hypothetical protein
MNLEPISSTDDRKRANFDVKGRFVAGNNVGHAGRPKGSRNKLGEAFVDDFYQVWLEEGIGAIRWMAKNDPSAFVRVGANILPQKFEADVNVGVKIVRLPQDLTSQELEALYHHQPKTIEHQPKQDTNNGNQD